MRTLELLRECVAAQAQGMDFERVYKVVIKHSGLWDGSSPTTYVVGREGPRHVKLIDGSHLVYDPEAAEWRHESV